MAIFLGFLFMLLLLGALAFTVFLYIKRKKRGVKKTRAGLITTSILAVAFLFLFITIPFGIKTIDAGEVGVIKVFGEARESRGAGVHFINIFTTKLDIYDAKVQQLEIDTEVYTLDAQPADIQMAVQFRIDSARVVDIATTYGTIDSLKSRLRNVSIERAKNELSKSDAMTLIQIRSTLSPAIQSAIAAVQEQFFILIENVVITDMSFSSAFEKAVEEKMIAEQKKFEAEYAKEQAEIKAREQAEVARINAEADLVVAKLNAERALTEAKGRADAEVAIASGAARALKIQYVETARMLGLPVTEVAITEQQEDEDGNTVTIIIGYEYEIDVSEATEAQYKILMEYMQYINYLETWDGKLPQVIGDGSTIGGIIISP